MRPIHLLIYTSRDWDNPYIHICGKYYSSIDTMERRVGNILDNAYEDSPLFNTHWRYNE